MAGPSFLQACSSCHHEFRAPERLIGRQVNCSYCGKVITIEKPVEQNQSDDPLVGRVIRGCELKRRLGAGTMGAVYQAHYQKGDRMVAIKLLSDKAAKRADLVQRFEREARLCKDISHPHVIQAYDVGQEKNVHFMVMEFVDGQCLATLIEDRGKIPWQEAAGMMRKLASALARANEINVIHRDIKPANIIVDNNGEPKLADLGLGKQIGNEDDNGLTMQGTAMGTPAYMAPEQISDASSVTPAADVYGLGATFFHVIAGRRPYEGKNSAEILTKLRNEDAPELKDLVPDVPQGFNDLIMQMIEKNPGDRPAHPSILIQEIDATLAAPSKARQRRRRAAAQRHQQRHKKSNMPIIMLLLIIVVGIAAYLLYTELYSKQDTISSSSSTE